MSLSRHALRLVDSLIGWGNVPAQIILYIVLFESEVTLMTSSILIIFGTWLGCSLAAWLFIFHLLMSLLWLVTLAAGQVGACARQRSA